MLSSFGEVAVLMSRFFRHELIHLLVFLSFGLAGCSPAPEPRVGLPEDPSPAPPIEAALAQPPDGGAVDITSVEDPDAKEFTVDDCEGGKTVAPLWIRNVPF